jgi:uncharacterized protein (DUF433 family)
MPKTARALHLPQALDDEISREAEMRGKSWSAVTADLLEEAIRIRRIPGIVFADGPTGRRAVVAGSGLDVWEIVATWQHEGKDFDLLRRSYPWMTDPQLRAALSYYELHPEEIEERLARERQWTPERVARELPLISPRKRPAQP